MGIRANKMKEMGMALSGLILMAVVLLASIIFLRTSILQAGSPKALRILFQRFAPPKDLYDYLVNEEIDLSKDDVVRRFEFKHKYTGKHNVGILLSHMPDELYELKQSYFALKVRLEVNFYVGGKLTLSHHLGDEYHPFIGRTGSGLILATYNCPEDLPTDTLVLCEVKVVQPDRDLNRTYGPIKFYIRKMSDE